MDFYSDTAQRISRAYFLLSKSHKRIADFILGTPSEAAMMTIEELSDACNVSIATANRFAKAIGFEGFAEFRAHQMEAFRQTLAPVEKLKAEKYEAATSFDIVLDGISQDIANLEGARETLTAESCDKALELILQSERIFTYGSGISYSIAGILTHGLEPFCHGNVTMMGVPDGVNSAHRRLVHAGGKDLVILISFPRYSADTIELMKTAKEQGTRILCITDRPSSPLAADADVVLYAPTERRLLPNSGTAAFSLVVGLVAAVANRRQEGLDVQMRLAARHLPDIVKKKGGDPKE